MTTVILTDELGNPVERQVKNREAIISPSDRENLEPAVTQRVEYDHTGQSSSITTTCGETENRRESDDKPDITIEGILTNDQIETAKLLKEGEEITIVSDVHQGQVFVKRLTIEQSSDLISFVPDGSNEERLAFHFQLQLRQPE